MMSRIAIITGEASGDLHGSLLAKYMRDMCPGIEIWGAGGKRMREAGVNLICQSGSTGAIGIVESLKLVPGLLMEYFRVRRELLRRRPDVLTLIDFGAFNKRVLGFAKRHGIKIVYYIPPGAWRKKRRNPGMAQMADKVITPFDWSYRIFKDAGIDVTLVGHPLLDIVKPRLSEQEFRQRFNLRPDSRLVALLPGSRKQEITHISPALLRAAKIIDSQVPDLQYVVAAAGPVRARQIERIRYKTLEGSGGPDIRIVESMTHDCLAHSCLALTASGTATLEAAILNTPMVIVYRGSFLSHFEYLLRAGKALEDHIGLPNIIAEKTICPELLSQQASPEMIARLAVELLLEPSKAAAMKEELAKVRSTLGKEGGARMAAKVVLEAAGLLSTN